MPDRAVTPRPATFAEVALLGRIGAEGFFDDPVFSWVFPDAAARLDKLAFVFTRMAADVLDGSHSAAWIAGGACTAWWRDPSYDHHPAEEARSADAPPADAAVPAAPPVEVQDPLGDEDRERLRILGETMHGHHPHEPHWYLNVVSTRPAEQGRGLGAAVLEPTLARCDAEAARAYLVSTNPRNRTLYRRSGFVDAEEFQIGDGPSVLAMWRDPLG